MTITTNRNTIYAKLQSVDGTAVNPTISDAIRVVSWEWMDEGSSIKRESHAQGYDGGLPPVASSRQAGLRVKLEIKSPTTRGTKSTWQQYPLFACVPNVRITEVPGVSGYIRLDRQSGRTVMVDYVPATIVTYERNGAKKKMHDARGNIEEVLAQPNGINEVTLMFKGTYNDEADYDADDVKQVVTYQVTTGATGDWLVVVTDNRGHRTSTTVTGSATIATLIDNITAAMGSDTIVDVADNNVDTVTFTSKTKGIPITVVVTPAGSGAGTQSTTTANVCFSELPTYSNDGGEICVNLDTTVTALSNVATVGAFSFKLNASLIDRPGVGANTTNGYAAPSMGAAGYCTLSWMVDALKPSAYAIEAAWRNATETELVLEVTDSWKLRLPSAAHIDPPKRNDRNGEQAWSEVWYGYGSLSTSHWELFLYGGA